eukprot:NODE_104_length_19294_cov_0.449179.p2 type:complete len:651 gc:universal NODE_104_length_19294_cov_0.449179:13177-15129(+)
MVLRVCNKFYKMSRLIEYLITGVLTDDSFIQHVIYPNNLEKLFLTNLHYMFKPKKFENAEYLWYEFQLTDEFGNPLYGSCYSQKTQEGKYFVVAMLSSYPKSYTFRSMLNEVHLCHQRNLNIYKLLAEFCRLVIPDTFQIVYQMPFSKKSINLDYENDCLSHLMYQYLPNWLIATILHDTLLEKSVLLISTSLTKLFHCSISLQTLMKPLKYNGIIVPLIPYSMIQTIEAPTFYIMGAHKSALQESGNFNQSDLIVDLDNLECINDRCKNERDIIDIENYCRKVFKILIGYVCHQDYSSHLIDQYSQESEFRLLWRNWIINLCSHSVTDKTSRFRQQFSRTSAFKQFIYDDKLKTHLKSIYISSQFSTELDPYEPFNQDKYVSLMRNRSEFQNQISAIISKHTDLDFLLYARLCEHVWKYYDEYNQILDFEDCESILEFILNSKLNSALVSSKVEDILNHLSDIDKSKIYQWDLPLQLKEKFDKYTKRRSTQLLRKSLYVQKSDADVTSDLSLNILGDLNKALQYELPSTIPDDFGLTLDNNIILNENFVSKDLKLLYIEQVDLVTKSSELLSLMIELYNETSSLMYRSEKKDPIARTISDRKKISNLKKSDHFNLFMQSLCQFTSYSLESLTSDTAKLCFWLNCRQILL